MTHTQNTHNTRGNAKKNKKPTKLILVFKPKINTNSVDAITTASNSPVNDNAQIIIPPAPIVIPPEPFVFQPISPTLTYIPSEMTSEDYIRLYRPGIIYELLTDDIKIAMMEDIYVDILIQQQNVDVISPGLRACENENNNMPDLTI